MTIPNDLSHSTTKQAEAVFIYDERETAYRFHSSHPFNQQRLLPTVDLLRTVGALPGSGIHTPSPAEDAQILLVHSREYMDAVIALSEPHPAPDWTSAAGRFGLDTEDTPYFPDMHCIAARIVGGSVQAVDTVMSGRAKHALHLAGGLHHALPSKGAGFCVYNDAAVAIAHAKLAYGARVLYVDTDVHHGDGVQWSFYTDPDVCTFSIHETGKFLFPGTGAVNERGEGEGFGANVNVPVEPYTEDESWMDSFIEAVTKTAAAFKPDLIVSQHGCDAHAYDPLAHIHCSMHIYQAMPEIIHQLAEQYCEGRWVALGGGGYDIWRVVPRAWSLLWLEMSGHPLLGELASYPGLPVPEPWLKRWQPHSEQPLPGTWLDPSSSWPPIPRRAEIAHKNKQTVELATMYLG